MDGSGPRHAISEETVDTLAGLGRGRFGRIESRRIAEHIISNAQDADWSVMRAALDALARRYGFAQRAGLKLASRPTGCSSTYLATLARLDEG